MRKVVAILMVALVCCGFIPQHKAVQPTKDTRSTTEIYAEAIKRLKIHNDTVGATQNLMVLLAKDSTNAEALYLYSRITKDKKERILFSEMAYNLDTTNNFYLNHYAYSLYGEREYDKAFELFKKLVKKKSEPRDFHSLAVILYSHFKNLDAALQVVNEAIDRFGRNPLFVDFRQFLLLNSGRVDVAEKEALREIEKAPHLIENYLSLADLYENTKQDSLAKETYKRALTIDSTAINAWLGYASFCRRNGDAQAYLFSLKKIMESNDILVEDKLGEWENITKWNEGYRLFYPLYNDIINTIYTLHPDNKGVKLFYAKHLFMSGQREESLATYKKCLKEPNPDFSTFVQVIDLENSVFNRPDSAVHYLNRALEAFPKNSSLHFVKGNSLVGEGKLNESLIHYEEALKYVENDTLRSNILAAVGNVYHLGENMKNCYKSYNLALLYNADNAEVLNNYAYFLSLENKKLKVALQMATRANELSENNPTYLDTKAWVLYKLGLYTEAKTVMQKALSLNRSQGYEYPLHYAHILYALGEEFMAKTYWRKALEACTTQEEVDEVNKSINKVIGKKKR